MTAACIVLLERCDSILSKEGKTIMPVKETVNKRQLNMCNMTTCVVMLEKCDGKLVDARYEMKIPEKKKKEDCTTQSKGHLCECLCGSAFRNRSLLMKHINSHREKILYKLNGGNTFSGTTKFPNRKHDMEHFQCRSCRRAFKIRPKFHENEQHISNNRRYVCWKCNSKFASERQLTCHACVPSMVRVKPYRCNFCNATFDYTKHLRRHVINFHEMPLKTSHKCKKCQSMFLCADDLTFHYRRCRKQEARRKSERKARSSKVGKQYEANSNKKDKNCPNTTAVSATPSSTAKTHVKMSTTQSQNSRSRSATRRYKCLHCDAYFGNLIYYKKHADTHRYLKLTNTQDAEALDTWKKQLEANLSIKAEPESTVDSDASVSYGSVNTRVNAEDMTYNCLRCKAKFSSESDLHAHEHSHIVNTEFKCVDCDTVFGAKKYFIRHRNKYHKNTQFVDEQHQVTCDNNDENSTEISGIHAETGLNSSLQHSDESQNATLTDEESSNVATSNVGQNCLAGLETNYSDITDDEEIDVTPVPVMEAVTENTASVVTTKEPIEGNLNPIHLSAGEHASLADGVMESAKDNLSVNSLEPLADESTELIITPDIHFVDNFNDVAEASSDCSREIGNLANNQFDVSGRSADRHASEKQHSCSETSCLVKPQVEYTNVSADHERGSLCGSNSAIKADVFPIIIYRNGTNCRALFKNVASANYKVSVSKKLIFRCEICALRFQRKNTLNKHIKSKHSHLSSKVGLFKCGRCERQFNSKSLLFQHRRRHHYKPITSGNTQNAVEKLHKCEECNASFTKKFSLDRHTRIHKAESQHNCLLCNSAFSNEIYLSRHISSFHRKKIKRHKKEVPCTSNYSTALQTSQSTDEAGLFPIAVEVNHDVQQASENASQMVMCSECCLPFPNGCSTYSPDAEPLKCQQCRLCMNPEIVGTVTLF